MEQLTIRQTQSIEPEQNHYPLDSQKSEDSCRRQLQVPPQPKLHATIIDTNHSHEIPVGKPIYACTKSQKELKSLKICYSVCTLFIITLLLARIIPQFIYDGYVLSAIVWILCSSLYLFNFTIFFLFIDKRTLFVLNTWIIVNCIIFITDLIGTVLGLGTPLYKSDCEESMWKDEAENCETKKKFKTAFSIIYIVFLLINGIIYGIYCYRAYKIRKLLRFQEKLSARLPSSTQIQC